ncbi:CNDP dipeptidase [Suillus clintonianus]|uniref:CNDP dipeptidase n=1 Tax=Suillus clintonianus TaxID=1904413 RepID=UPI001B8752A7|nr:CNDP dipeptidase [Suillus clintonianus]KAG2134130.1 CNDP dipeptidase [Suillus clintonianus]
MPAPPEFLKYIDDNQGAFIKRLTDAVSHKRQVSALYSVSGDPTLRKDVIDMGETWLHGQLTALGVETKLVWLGNEDVDGQTLQLPPLVIGRVGSDPKKKTVLVYGHYDVMPAKKSDGWTTEDPFELTVRDERMIGRGATDDKGPVVGWLNVLEAHQALPLTLPVNVRFCFEGMEESGSTGLDKFIEEEANKGKEGWFDGVSYVCITDNYWLNTRKPALTFGIRGTAYFSINISGPATDLHSGLFGRMVHEPMTDMVKLLSKLVETNGIITVPGVEETVNPVAPEEREEYEKMDYTVQDLRDAVGGKAIELSEDHTQLVMNRMRFPSLSIHGIKGAFDGDGSKTVIPAAIKGRFSLRLQRADRPILAKLCSLVEPQTTDIIKTLVTNFLNEEFKKLNSKNTMEVEYVGGALPWVATNKHDLNFKAAHRATEAVYRQAPDYTREGGSIGVALTFQEELGEDTSVMLLPMGRSDDGAHSTDEKLDKDNFFKGTKLFGTYLYELAAA